jgi:hypothetical protein
MGAVQSSSSAGQDPAPKTHLVRVGVVSDPSDKLAQKPPGSLTRSSSLQSLKSLKASDKILDVGRVVASDKSAKKAQVEGSLVRSSSRTSLTKKEEHVKSLNVGHAVASDKSAKKAQGSLVRSSSLTSLTKKEERVKSLNVGHAVASDKSAKKAQGSLVRSSSLTSLTKKEEQAIKEQSQLDLDFQRSRRSMVENSLRW